MAAPEIVVDQQDALTGGADLRSSAPERWR
jgi:hypothetical protein